MRKTLLYLLELVAAIVNEGGETGDADAKRTEPEVVQNDGGQSNAEAYEDERVEETSHFANSTAASANSISLKLSEVAEAIGHSPKASSDAYTQTLKLSNVG